MRQPRLKILGLSYQVKEKKIRLEKKQHPLSRLVFAFLEMG